jgi:hypothetical protein
MDALTFSIAPDEFLGLSALAGLDRQADTSHPDGAADAVTDAEVLGRARTLMRDALADKLAAADLPWAPPAEAVRQHAAEAAKRTDDLDELAANDRVRKDAAYVLVVAGLITLVGGYAGGWNWTGFQQNGQVWDWLNLLLFPVVLGTIPLWITNRPYIGKGRKIMYGAFIVAFAGFVLAGYLVPINWSGFYGMTLWNWIEMLALPAALAITAALTGRGIRYRGRLLRPYEKGIVIALVAGWVVTVIGGYALRWTWTGYVGNTLWDWLQKLLAPVILPAIVLPFLIKWVSGNAAGRAARAHEAPAVPASLTVPPTAAASEAAERG